MNKTDPSNSKSTNPSECLQKPNLREHSHEGYFKSSLWQYWALESHKKWYKCCVCGVLRDKDYNQYVFEDDTQ